LSESVEVINNQGENTLTIFNSAGEIVRHMVLTDSYPRGIVDIEIPPSEDVYAPTFDSNGNNTSTPLNIKGFDSQGVSHTISWDGKNDLGQPVASGTYVIQMLYVSGGGVKTVVSRTITVIQTASNITLAGAVLGPNPVMSGGQFIVISYPASSNYQAVAQIYTLSGELVAKGIDPGATGRVKIDVSKLSGGIYLVELEKVEAGQVGARLTLKLGVAR
jgi:hypothetical protein